MVNFTCIVSKDAVFITKHPTGIPSNVTVLFDNEPGEQSYHRDYVKINKYPEQIQFLQTTYGTHYYLLKDKDLLGKYPEKLSYSDLYDEDGDFFSVSGLYEQHKEADTTQFIELKYTINKFEVDDFDFISSSYNGQVSFIYELSLPKVLHSTVPNYLSSEQFYKIIRDYVRNNINPKIARITSDYDFCFTVKKLVQLNETVEYKVDVSRTKRPKYEVRFKNEELITCFEMAPKPYQKYPVIEPIAGNNAKDLEEKVNTYLKNLIENINTPTKVCSCCNGTGTVMR